MICGKSLVLLEIHKFTRWTSHFKELRAYLIMRFIRIPLMMLVLCYVTVSGVEADEYWDEGWDELKNWAAGETVSDPKTVGPPSSESATLTPTVQKVTSQKAEYVPGIGKPKEGTSSAISSHSSSTAARVSSATSGPVIRRAGPVTSSRSGVPSEKSAGEFKESPEKVEPPKPVLRSVRSVPQDRGPASAAPNFFVEHFMMRPEARLDAKANEVSGILFVETPGAPQDARLSVVTDFGGTAVRTRPVPGLQKMDDTRKWIQDHLEVATFEGVEIRRLKFVSPQGAEQFLYWVGHKAYDSADKARAEIAVIQSAAQSQNLDFKKMVDEAHQYLFPKVEASEPVSIRPEPNYQREEKLILTVMDRLDIGEKLYGPFTGVPQGEPILWQSFGKVTWRQTALDAKNWSNVDGFWSNRLVFKGIRAPLNTIDPFIEATTALETNGNEGGSHIDLSAGLEWRPFGHNPWLYNYRPWGLPLLEWIRSYRIYAQYIDRKNIKDEIAGSRDYDFRTGVQIFYEWGTDPPPVGEGKPNSVPEFLRRYSWGEYFGDYRWEWTNFSIEDDYEGIIWNSAIMLGIKLPGIPLPPNPINDEFVLMPYMFFEHVNSTEFSFYYQNRYYVGAGCRWMPFANHRYKENEWLSKTKLFIEYVGVGGVHYAKQDEEPAYKPDWDLRFGLNFSSKRF